MKLKDFSVNILRSEADGIETGLYQGKEALDINKKICELDYKLITDFLNGKTSRLTKDMIVTNQIFEDKSFLFVFYVGNGKTGTKEKHTSLIIQEIINDRKSVLESAKKSGTAESINEITEQILFLSNIRISPDIRILKEVDFFRQDYETSREGERAEISEEKYFYFMEVLPPIFLDGGFYLSEALTHNLYYFFEEKDNKYFAEVRFKKGLELL